MTDTATNELTHLVQEGQAAINAGDMATARERLRRATELDPLNSQAWLGLSAAVPVLSEKKQYLLKVLELEPGSTEARASLTYVERLIGEGLQLAPSRRREVRNESGDASPLLSSPAVDIPATEILHCYRHPERETGLLCTNCSRPICSACAKPAVVGQLCPECRKERRPNNYKVSGREITMGGLVAFVVAALVAFPLMWVPFGFFAFFILALVGPMIAEFIVRVVDRVTKVKRGRSMQVTVGVAIALGTLPFLAFNFLFLLMYMVVAISVATTRLR